MGIKTLVALLFSIYAARCRKANELLDVGELGLALKLMVSGILNQRGLQRESWSDFNAIPG